MGIRANMLGGGLSVLLATLVACQAAPGESSGLGPDTDEARTWSDMDADSRANRDTDDAAAEAESGAPNSRRARASGLAVDIAVRAPVQHPPRVRIENASGLTIALIQISNWSLVLAEHELVTPGTRYDLFSSIRGPVRIRVVATNGHSFDFENFDLADGMSYEIYVPSFFR